MPTWYSIRNQLEAGAVKANNSLERFFTGFITAYGCIDVWYRSVASDSSAIECRIYYIQKDPGFTASESWERDNERPEYWLQIKGSEAEIRASVISLLPHIAKLHTDKRHGEWNFGATQPFDGQGSIITVQPGTGNIVITGRFGDLALYSDGTELNWEDIVWEFDGCSPTATGPPADTVCFQFGNELERCRPTSDPTGTCLTGSCGNWTATAGQTSAECTAAGGVQWYNGVDLTDWTQDQWDADQSCPDPTGTCVTGTCGGGWTVTYPVTEAACSGNWYKGVDLTGQPNPDYWDDLYNCADPLGCCVVGSTCDWDFIGVTTQSECTTLGGVWTEGVKGKSCSIGQYEEDNGCNPSPPQTISVTATLYYTVGFISFIPWPGFEPYLYTRSFNSLLRPAITPGSKLAISPTIPTSGELCEGFTYSNFDPTLCQTYGTQTVTYTFSYLYGNESDATYGIDATIGHPGITVAKNLVSYNTDWWDGTCGGDAITVDGIHAYQYEGQAKKINGTVNGTLRRVYTPETGATYTGQAVFTAQTNPAINSRSIIFAGGSSSMTVPSLFVGPSKFVTQGLPNDIFNTAIPLGDLTLNTETSDITWGYPDAEFLNTPDVIPFEVYRITTSVLEAS